jgi:hypothetical protein
MNTDALEGYVRALGLNTERVTDSNGQPYLVIWQYEIPAGTLRGTRCDVALLATSAVPYVPPPAIHTRPPVAPPGTQAVQASPLGPQWQYWSRVFHGSVLSPETMLAHIATVFREV